MTVCVQPGGERQISLPQTGGTGTRVITIKLRNSLLNLTKENVAKYRNTRSLKARSHMRFLMRFLLHFYCNFCCKCKLAAIPMQFGPDWCAMFISGFLQIATKLHEVSNMFETSATSRR